MQTIQILAMAFGSAWVSGINLYAVVATLGLLGRFGGLSLPGELSFAANEWVIGVAIALYCVEFVADKIPWLDSIWDVIHTFIRVPAGAVVAATALGDFNKPVQVVAFMIGGGLALSSHGTKATMRALLNLSPEPVTNIVASIVEDVVALLAILIVVFAPLLALLLLACAVSVTVLLLPRILRVLQRSFRKVRDMLAPRRVTAH